MKLMSSFRFLLLTALLLAIRVVGQSDSSKTNGWTLQDCIVYAQTHNIQVQQQQLNTDLSRVNLRQSQGAVLPNLNATGTHTYQYGRTIDRFTNTFANDRVLSQNFFISSNVTVFTGLQNYNSILQNKYSVEAGKFQVEQTRNDIAMNVASAYLNVLYAEEQLSVAEKQVEQTQQQVNRAQKLVDAGAAARGTLLDLQAQLAQEQVNVVNAQNNVFIATLTLTQLMNLDSTQNFRIVRPALNVPSENLVTLSPEQIYQIALSQQPGIRKADLDAKAADKGVAVAYGAYSPTIAVQGSLGTGYSGLAKELTGSSLSGADTFGITTGGDFVLIPTFNNTFAVVPFGEQMDNNFNQTFGVQVTVPIFNRFQVSTNVERAKIQRENADLNADLARQQLMKNIQQAWADAQAAFLRMKANEKALEAASLAFKDAEQRFNAGANNVIDYNNSKTRLAKAESDLIQARYDYIFRLKVLDFYQGKPLTF
jgi:outer membrane protein